VPQPGNNLDEREARASQAQASDADRSCGAGMRGSARAQAPGGLL